MSTTVLSSAPVPMPASTREMRSNHMASPDCSCATWPGGNTPPDLEHPTRLIADTTLPRIIERLEFRGQDATFGGWLDGYLCGLKLPPAARDVKPGGQIVIFDGDYASWSCGYSEPDFAKQMDGAIVASIVNKPQVMRTLPRLLVEAGLSLEQVTPHIFAEVGTGSFFMSAVEAYGPLPAARKIRSALMDTVTSKDGTAIAYQRSGTGPPLILVHGTSASHTRWRPVLPAFEERFTVYAVDRRGRGESGDAHDYAIEREFEDVEAVIDAAGDPVHLLGHSYGAICALEAALLTSNVRKLVLYEPPIPMADAPLGDDAVIERLQALLDEDDREAVVATFFREVVGMPEADLAMFRASPAWPARVAAAHTLPRELRSQRGYRFVAERFADFQIPTLLLLGGDSPRAFQLAGRQVDEALPNSRIGVMPGQQHIAMDTAPDLFVREVLAFLEEPARA